MRRSLLTTPILAICCLAAVLLPLCFAALLRDEGAVSGVAVSNARSELSRYLAGHPEQQAASLAVVDYSKPSFRKRMTVIDLNTDRRRSFLVAHGSRSGEGYATRFSNVPESNMSSLGLFRVTRIYRGIHGVSLRLEGLDSLRNGKAADRDIVLHAADYVSIPWIFWNLLTGNGPRIGRSSGCFVVADEDLDEVVRLLGSNGFIYAWSPLQQVAPANRTR